jgi:hypothetical protein
VEGTPTGTGIALSDPSDRFEQAAEAHAARVTSSESVAGPVGAASAPALQRQAGGTEELDEEATVQGLFLQRQGEGEEGEEEEDLG